jgi:hypothetical protein
MPTTQSNSQDQKNRDNFSFSPAGEKFRLPGKDDYQKEFQRLKKLADDAHAEDKEVVVVMGVGFVGAVMAAIVCRSPIVWWSMSNAIISNRIWEICAQVRRIWLLWRQHFEPLAISFRQNVWC